MPFPSFAGAEGSEVLESQYYYAQTGLRKLLNRAHTYLYKTPHKGKEVPRCIRRPASRSWNEANSSALDPNAPANTWSVRDLKELSGQLKGWRTTLPMELRWDDEDPPPVGINAARLRAKYWGAQYVIHRPFLHRVIHPPEFDGVTKVVPPPTAPSGISSSSQSPLAPGQVDLQGPPAMTAPLGTADHHSASGLIDEWILEACRNCIHAAFKSTQAFHGIPEHHRPIVTNIFGTAHA